MESSKKVFCTFDRNALKEGRKFQDVIFTEPRLLDYKEVEYDILKPTKKIFYFKQPKRYPIDLYRGNRSFTERITSNLGLKAPLKYTLEYIMSSSEESENLDKIKIYTRRGILIDLMEAFYYPNKYLECQLVRVSRYNGDLYMIGDKKRKETGVPLKPHHTHDGQFLKNVFTESFDSEPNIDKSFDANKEFRGIFQSNFGDFDLIYSSPIYGIQAEDEFKDFDDMEALNNCRFVMAKQMWHHQKNDPLKHLNYYLQAHLAKVKDLYLAYKGNDGQIREPIIHKRASELVLEYKSHWKPSTCFAFLYNFLHEVNKLMSKDKVDSLKTVYEFYVIPCVATVTYRIFEDKPEMMLATSEYMKYCQEKFQN